MKSVDKIIRTNAYWRNKIQSDLYAVIRDYLKANSMTQSKFADQLNVSKGYVSQVFSGDNDHKLSKIIDLALSIGKAPVLKYEDLEDYIENDKMGFHNINTSAPYTINFIVQNVMQLPASDQKKRTSTDRDLLDTEIKQLFSQETDAEIKSFEETYA